MNSAQGVAPLLHYKDPAALAQWLCKAFGFSEHETVAEPDGSIVFISLEVGNGLALICPASASPLQNLIVQPAQIGGANTQTCYVCVDDVRAHKSQAVAAGAALEIDEQPDSNGDLYYACRDPEGHVWYFGSSPIESRSAAVPVRRPGAVGRAAMSMAMMLLIGGLVAGLLYLFDTDAGSRFVSSLMSSIRKTQVSASDNGDHKSNDLQDDTRGRDAAAGLAEQLARARSMTLAAEGALHKTEAQLSQALADKATAEQALHAAQSVSEQLQAAQQKSIGSAVDTREALAKLQGEHQLALTHIKEQEQALHQMEARLSQAIAEKDAAEQAVLAARAEAGELQVARQEAVNAAADARRAVATLQDEHQLTLGRLMEQEQATRQTEARLSQAVADKEAVERTLHAAQSEVERLQAAQQGAADVRRELAGLQEQYRLALTQIAEREQAARGLEARIVEVEAARQEAERLKAASESALAAERVQNTRAEMERGRSSTATEAVIHSDAQGQESLNAAEAPAPGPQDAGSAVPAADSQPSSFASVPGAGATTGNSPSAKQASKGRAACRRALVKVAARASGIPTMAELTPLCASASLEPVRCFDWVMGSGSDWSTEVGVALCGGSRSARATVDCFRRQLASQPSWQDAVAACTAH